ncbi:hypothetical protein NQ839_01050, partial [Acinetobacter baumannii]|nr:hypothetical protein [Acinetobacter baumannii]
MAQLAPMMQLRARFEDKCGHPLAGGSVFAFEVGTSTPKDTFKDANGTIPNTHPIKLDYRGEADIYLLSGRYRFVVYSCTGVKIYDVDNVGEWLGTINALAVTHVDSLEGLNAISNVWDGRTIYVKDLGNYRYDALTTSWVKAYQDADNVKDGIETQKLINNKTIQKVESISDLINLNPRNNGQVVQVLSFHAGKDRGGDYFKWSATLSKSLHDGGYFIDPLIAIPPLATFNTYYLPRNSGNGIWVRLNNKQDIYAEAYGLVKMSDDPTAVWSCAAIQQAIYKASVKSNTDYSPKTARVMPGRYYTTNPIVLTQIDGFSARLPALSGGNGNSIYDVELIKTTQNTVGPGYYGGDVDAVIFTSAKTSGSQY